MAQAFLIGRNFVGDDACALILGDNIFYGHGLGELLRSAAERTDGATIFAYEVNEPERYGIVTFNETAKPCRSTKSRCRPSSKWAVTGLYFYDNDVVRYASEIVPSARGELEITDVNRKYLAAEKLTIERMGRGFAGSTPERRSRCWKQPSSSRPSSVGKG